MWFINRDEEVRASPSVVFGEQVDAMNNFALRFGQINKKRNWVESVSAYNMLTVAASLTSQIARTAVIDALSSAYKLGELPDTVARSMTAVKSDAVIAGPSGDYTKGTRAVFFSLANPDKPADVYVAALVRNPAGFGATPAFFMATPQEAADPKVMMAKAKSAYTSIRDARQHKQIVLS